MSDERRGARTDLREAVGSEVVVHQRGDIPARYPVGAGLRRRGSAPSRGAHSRPPRVRATDSSRSLMMTTIEQSNCLPVRARVAK